MKVKHFYSLIVLCTTVTMTYSQIGINTPTPHATLDVVASTNPNVTDGILPPRVSKQQLAEKESGIYGSDQTGAIVYITDATAPSGTIPSIARVGSIHNTGYHYFTGWQWVPFSTNLYNSDGILSEHRVVTQDANTLAFTSTAVNGFSVDGTTLSVDASNHRMGFGTSSPETRFHVVSTTPGANRYNLIDATTGASQYGIMALRNTSALASGNYSLLGFTNNGPSAGGANWVLGSIRTGATLTNGTEEDFYIGNSIGGILTEKMRINPITGNIGIGTTAATNRLHINSNNPIRLEGLQPSSGSAGTLTVNNKGVVQLQNSSSISAARGTGSVIISANNTPADTSISTKNFDNLSELTGNIFTPVSTGLYKIDFIINYPQRTADEDGGDGYLGYSKISLNGVQQSFTSTKVTVPEVLETASFITCTNSTVLKIGAGEVLSFQALSLGSIPDSSNIVAPFTINVIRID